MQKVSRLNTHLSNYIDSSIDLFIGELRCWTTRADVGAADFAFDVVLGNTRINRGNCDLVSVIFYNLGNYVVDLFNVQIASISPCAADEKFASVMGASSDVRRQISNVGFVGNSLATHTELEWASVRATGIDNYGVWAIVFNAVPKVMRLVAIADGVNVKALDRCSNLPKHSIGSENANLIIGLREWLGDSCWRMSVRHGGRELRI